MDRGGASKKKKRKRTGTVDRAASDMASIFPQMMNLLYRLVDKEAEQMEELTLPQCKVLDALTYDGEARSLSEVSHELGVTQGTLSVTIKKLSQLGYVTRDRDKDDERKVQIRLTDKGVKVKDARIKILFKFYQRLFSQMTAEERKKLVESHRFILSTYQQEAERRLQDD